jgi:DNA-binding transcriptional ArsR family regulator
MPKKTPSASLHEPLSVILGTQSKLAVLRILARAVTPLSIREVARRSGMAYRSIDLALADLIAAGICEDLAGGRERQVRLCSGHRLGPVIAGLLRAEADFFPSLRAELKAIAAGGEREGLLAAAIVGPTALREERLGEVVQVVLVAASPAAASHWQERFESAADSLAARFGVAFEFSCHDPSGTIGFLQERADRLHQVESLVGPPLAAFADEQ